MKLAVTSQNFRTVTPHAGRTRRFLLYEVGDDGTTAEVGCLDLPKEQALHDFHGEGPHALDAVDVLIVGSCGDGFVRRLGRRGVRVVRTEESDPLAAVRTVVDAGFGPIREEDERGGGEDAPPTTSPRRMRIRARHGQIGS